MLDALDLQNIALIIGKRERSILQDYLDCVAYAGLLPYKAILQWGGKEGESLYTHVLDGIFVMATLHPLLNLSDTETRALYTAFTVHDINKVLGDGQSFSNLATRENVTAEIKRLGLAEFFPDWEAYIQDITTLVRGHSGHHHSSGERWIAKKAAGYALGEARVNALLHLMRAADVVDLSHTLEESTHKADFLGHLNAYLADSEVSVQYHFATHRLTEQRGILTNVIHNAIASEMRARHGWIPLLYYPDGIAYLVPKGQELDVEDALRYKIAKRIAGAISDLTAEKFRDFIQPAPSGIKVDSKCLELGVPFPKIWKEIYNIVQRRTPSPTELDVKVREWAERGFEKARADWPEVAPQVRAALDSPALLVSEDLDRLHQAELVRSYYIFLNTHFNDIPDAWARIYALLDLPDDRSPFYSFFDARWARAYVISRDLALSEEEIYRRIESDGLALTESEAAEQDPKVALFANYLDLYAIFADGRTAPDFGRHLAHYVENQHRQCVYCSGPFSTTPWMAADVRSDITVQAFSNRLRGGPGEPKKNICAVCHLQFLLEKLTYPQVRGEKTIYLHLYPYSFLTGPFIEGLRTTVQRILEADTALQALNMRVPEAIRSYLDGRVATPTFRSRTQKDKPQPFGLYLPRYAETVGNLVIFPINPGGKNDTERFLFAFWNALLLQRYFGTKVLLSNAPIPPLGKEEIPDIYIDNIPLSCTGLLQHNDYSQFQDGSNAPGTLPALWEEVGHIFALRRLTFTTTDNTAVLVRSLLGSPLTVFYQTEKLLEARVRGQEAGGLLTWLSQQAFPHVESLALSKGGDFMNELSTVLQRLAEIAWKNGLRGRSLEKSSLLYPANQVLAKLKQSGGSADLQTLRAAAVQDIFDHLQRIAGEYKPGRKKWEATQQFVDIWFTDVLTGVYVGNLRRLLADEKLIRSAFLFYLRQQIPGKKDLSEEDAEGIGTEEDQNE